MVDTAPKNQFQPSFVFPPGDTLLESLDAVGMSQAELALRMGRPKKTVNGIIKGEVAITPETALQLERVLGVPASFWSNLQGIYQNSLAREREQEELQRQVEWLNDIPLHDMITEGWVRASEDRTQQLREVLNFFGVASPGQWRDIWTNARLAFRRPERRDIDLGAVSAWLRMGEMQAQKIRCTPFSAERFKAALKQIRKLTSESPEVFVPEVRRLCAEAGIAAVLVPQMRNTRVSGVARWLTPDKALIQLSLRYKSNDHFWFSFFHEAAHLLLHAKKLIFLDDGEQGDGAEAAADRFAAEWLISRASLEDFLGSHVRISKAAIRLFAAQIDIAPGIVVGRLQHEGHLPYSHCNDLKVKFKWKQGSRDENVRSHRRSNPRKC